MQTARKSKSSNSKSPNPGALARPKDRRETAASLLAAGVQVMSAIGYDAATTKGIAAVAGVNEQLISRYFGGKEGLLVAIMEGYKSSELLRERDMRPTAAGTVRAEILAFLSEADFSAQRESFARLALGRAIVDDRIARTINELSCDCYRPLLAERLQTHRLRGAINPSVDIDAIVEALIYVRLGLAAYGRMLFHLDSGRLRELCEVYADVFAHSLGRPKTAAKAKRR